MHDNSFNTSPFVSIILYLHSYHKYRMRLNNVFLLIQKTYILNRDDTNTHISICVYIRLVTSFSSVTTFSFITFSLHEVDILLGVKADIIITPQL